MVEYTLVRGTTSLALTPANGFYVRPGVEGLDTPPVRLSETEPADSDGSLVTNVRYAARDIVLPLHVEAGTAVDVRRITRGLASLLNPQLGPVTLRVSHAPSVTGNQLSATAADGVATAFNADTPDTLTTVNSPVRSGTNALQITGVAPLEATLKSAERPAVVAAATYTATVYVRAQSTTSTVCHVRLIWYNAGGSVITSTWSAAVTSSSSQWREVTVTAAAPNGAAKVGIGVYSAGAGTHLWDDFSLSEGATTREITGYASSPLGASLAKMEGLPWRRLAVALRCEDPLWLGAQSSAAIRQPGSWVTVTPIVSSGDAASWPTITVTMKTSTSAGDGVEIALIPAGENLTNSNAIGQFKVLFDTSTSSTIINTDPRNLSVLRANGNSAWPLITTIGDTQTKPFGFFAIPPGEWGIHSREMRGGIPGGAVGTITLNSRWLTAW